MKSKTAVVSVVAAMTLFTALSAIHKIEKANHKSITREAQGKIVETIRLIQTDEKIKFSTKEFECLAKNVYHEAGIESVMGKIAVAQVTMNRVNNGRWGKDVCKVVYAKSQFSWTLDSKKRWSQPKGELWNESIDAVYNFQNGVRVSHVEDSTFYHADYIKKPYWARVHDFTAKIGKHIFYKL